LSPKVSTDAAVIIPVYRTDLSAYEIVGLRRCFEVMSGHPIYFVAPHGMSLDRLDIPRDSFEVATFAADYFEAISGYNRLMLSKELYERFLDYRYILIHQLDAFVLSDQLSAWCSAGFDYIGAPWIEAVWKEDFSRSRYGLLRRLRCNNNSYVGNGGFSLRNIRKSIAALKIFSRMAADWTGFEDIFWGLAMPAYNPFFRVPDEETALRFSFESNPRECFRRNNEILPFGCHAWEKYDIGFWRPFFAELGYSI
jgi:hypothetical protein